MREYLPYILIFLGWPITSLITSYIRHRPRYLKSGVGTQHILLIGMIVMMAFIGAGVGLYINDKW